MTYSVFIPHLYNYFYSVVMLCTGIKKVSFEKKQKNLEWGTQGLT